MLSLYNDTSMKQQSLIKEHLDTTEGHQYPCSSVDGPGSGMVSTKWLRCEAQVLLVWRSGLFGEHEVNSHLLSILLILKKEVEGRIPP